MNNFKSILWTILGIVIFIAIIKFFIFMLPFVIFGAFMMFYNYARFGSVFDFGQNYNLTVMDMTAEHFNIEKNSNGFEEGSIDDSTNGQVIDVDYKEVDK